MADKCNVCGKTAYVTERFTLGGKCYHKLCFRCSECGISLNMENSVSVDGKCYCKVHQPSVSLSLKQQQSHVSANSLEAQELEMKKMDKKKNIDFLHLQHERELFKQRQALENSVKTHPSFSDYYRQKQQHEQLTQLHSLPREIQQMSQNRAISANSDGSSNSGSNINSNGETNVTNQTQIQLPNDETTIAKDTAQPSVAHQKCIDCETLRTDSLHWKAKFEDLSVRFRKLEEEIHE